MKVTRKIFKQEKREIKIINENRVRDCHEVN